MALIKESDDPEVWLDTVPALDPLAPGAKELARLRIYKEELEKVEENFNKEHGRLPEWHEIDRYMS